MYHSAMAVSMAKSIVYCVHFRKREILLAELLGSRMTEHAYARLVHELNISVAQCYTYLHRGFMAIPLLVRWTARSTL